MPSLPAPSLRNSCTRFLSYDAPRTAAETLQSLAAYAGDAAMDQGGAGELVTRLEESVRSLLGKEAALFMPSGKAAQNIALRLWCERSGSDTIAVHPQSHTQ
jgi:threonine aldolase